MIMQLLLLILLQIFALRLYVSSKPVLELGEPSRKRKREHAGSSSNLSRKMWTEHVSGPSAYPPVPVCPGVITSILQLIAPGHYYYYYYYYY